jgi:hypothetical protein
MPYNDHLAAQTVFTFKYVFASLELPTYGGNKYNDKFELLVDTVNYASLSDGKIVRCKCAQTCVRTLCIDALFVRQVTTDMRAYAVHRCLVRTAGDDQQPRAHCKNTDNRSCGLHKQPIKDALRLHGVRASAVSCARLHACAFGTGMCACAVGPQPVAQ